jgi:hypothetical protein
MARRLKFSAKRKINIPRVIAKITGVIIALYVGNEIISQVGSIVNNTSGAFNAGFKLIGWTVATSAGGNGCAGAANCVTSTSGSGILSVVGVVGIASIVMEFVQFKM